MDKFIEHLQEMGKVVVDNYEHDITELQKELLKHGYDTVLINGDFTYLKLK